MPNDLAKPALIGAIALGALALVASTYYASSYLAIFGLALVFWGAVLLYVLPSTKRLLLANSRNIEKILIDNNLNGKGIYMPTNNRTGPIVFVPALDLTVNLLERNSRNTQLGKKGMYISPPGQALCKVFEQQIGVTFARMNLEKFQTVFPKILVDELAFAHSVSIQIDETIVTIGIIDSIFQHICQNTNSQLRAHRQVGCLLTSAIACALAKVTGNPITIQSEILMPPNRTLIQFQIMPRKED